MGPRTLLASQTANDFVVRPPPKAISAQSSATAANCADELGRLASDLSQAQKGRAGGKQPSGKTAVRSPPRSRAEATW